MQRNKRRTLVFDRLYKDSLNDAKATTKKNNTLADHHTFRANLYHDGSLFAATLRRDRMKAKIEMLK